MFSDDASIELLHNTKVVIWLLQVPLLFSSQVKIRNAGTYVSVIDLDTMSKEAHYCYKLITYIFDRISLVPAYVHKVSCINLQLIINTGKRDICVLCIVFNHYLLTAFQYKCILYTNIEILQYFPKSQAAYIKTFRANGYRFLPNSGGNMKKLGSHFFNEKEGSQK